MLSAMEKAKNALTVTLDTLEKSLNITSGQGNKGIVRRKLETLQKHYDHLEELYIETEVEEAGRAAAAGEFEEMTDKFYEMAARVDVILVPVVPPPQPARQRSNSTSSTVMDSVEAITGEQVQNRIKGLEQLLDAQVKKLLEHSDAVAATRNEVETWKEDCNRLKDRVENELWALYTALSEKDPGQANVNDATRQETICRFNADLDRASSGLAKLLGDNPPPSPGI